MTLENKFLVRQYISVWTARKLDKDATKEAKERAEAGSKANVKLYKTILAGDELDEVQKVANAARIAHRKRTVPWTYEGVGAITAQGFGPYQTEMADFEQAFYAAVARFMDVYERDYSALMNDANHPIRKELGAMFKRDDYPHPTSLRGKFAFKLHCEPIAGPEAFQVSGLPETVVQAIRTDIVASNRDAIENANNVAWARVIEKVETLYARLSEYTAGTVTKFYDSWVDNIKEIADLIPSINIANDADLTRMGQKLKMLTVYPAATLKEKPTVRNEIARQAAVILSEISHMKSAA